MPTPLVIRSIITAYYMQQRYVSDNELGISAAFLDACATDDLVERMASDAALN